MVLRYPSSVANCLTTQAKQSRELANEQAVHLVSNNHFHLWTSTTQGIASRKCIRDAKNSPTATLDPGDLSRDVPEYVRNLINRMRAYRRHEQCTLAYVECDTLRRWGFVSDVASKEGLRVRPQPQNLMGNGLSASVASEPAG
ncbi:unnamed protein product, partial [Iphiclides podalirius]